MFRKTFIPIIFSVILLISIYIVFIVDYGNTIESGLVINNTKYENYLMKVKECDKINATILSIFGYECSKVGCDQCRSNCMSPKIVEVNQYKCYVLNIYNKNKMVYKVTVDGCLKQVDTDKITDYRDKWQSDSYIYAILLSTAILLLTLILVGLCIYRCEIR